MKKLNLMFMVVCMVLLFGSCKQDEPNEPKIDYNEFLYSLSCRGEALGEDNVIVVPPEGGTYVLELKASAENYNETIVAPDPEFSGGLDSWSAEQWIEEDFDGTKVTIKVLPYEERNVGDRTAYLYVWLNNYDYNERIEIKINQSAEFDKMIFRRSYASDDECYETAYGWYFHKLRSVYVYLSFYVFGDEEPTITLTNPDFTATVTVEDGKSYNGRECKHYDYQIRADINTTGATRSTEFTISLPTGERYIKKIIQEYHSIGASPDTFTINGTTYSGWQLDHQSYLCYLYVEDLNRGGVTPTISGYKVSLYANELIYNGEYYNRYKLTFKVPQNDDIYDYKATVYVHSNTTNEEIGPFTIYQKSKYGSGGGGGGGGGGGSDDTSGYTITSTSVCAIYALDNSNSGDKYTKSYYKWVSSSGRVILSTSRSSNSGWIGVASNNYDSSCKGYSVSSYKYRVVDYSPVGGAWYYYFN